ncbi:MAG: cytochrome c oxidase subunit I [Chloroflexi bacterium]|nr:cytochrome c oxidase subunit I [Chloroflexota bacterium]
MATHTASLSQPQYSTGGLSAWLTTVDHKMIGILYLLGAGFFLLVGGLEALLIRTQLIRPENTFLVGETYNQVLTMHGTTMVFLVIMPMLAGMGNYIVPLMLGARDMAFPRLNAFGVWMFLLGGIFLNLSFILGGAPAAGWFSYTPLSNTPFSPGTGIDFWIFGINMFGISSISASVNFVVTILNMRAPGLTLNRLPIFVWTTLTTAFLLLFALPSIAIATILLYLDRNLGMNFYRASGGGDPLIWQHLFWFFGHPEVYVMILPAMGIVSEILPVFSRKPLFGYTAVAYSSVAIGFLGFTVWAHHMFAVGLPPLINAAFAFSSMLIAIPTAIKIFNWTATLWGGNIQLRPPLLYAVGFIALFIIGGLTGIYLAVVPIDYQITDTYFVVGHLHYVLFGGSLIAIFGGIHYWFPKMTGRMMDERLGHWQFWLLFLGALLAFIPMLIVGVEGMPRRVYTYGAGLGWDIYNLLSTLGAYMIAVSVLVFLYNFFFSLFRGKPAGDDPWDGHTLEWATTSPPAVYNFEVVPVVKSRRPVWDMKYSSDHHPRRLDGVQPEAAHNLQDVHIHLPPPSWWPLVLSVGIMIMAFGFVFNWIIILVGLVVFLWGVSGWIQQDVNAPQAPAGHGG